MRLVRRIREFLTRGMWEKDLSDSTVIVRLAFYLARFVALVVRGVTGDRMSIWASALTYLTLISAVPFVALVVGIGSKLGVPGSLVASITGDLPQEQVELISGAAAYFENFDFRPVGLVSILLLVYAGAKVLLRIESAFNEIWGVEKERGTLRRIATFVAAVVFVPALLLLAMVLTGSLLSSAFVGWVMGLPHARSLAAVVLRFLPLLATWAALALLYWLLPYTKVKFRAALLGGFVAGLLSQILQQGFFQAQLGVSKLGVMYGAFAAIPIFLVWVYMNWTFILLGMQITYGAQHAREWLFDGEEGEPATGPRVQDIALRVAVWLSPRDGLHTATEIGTAIGAPVHLVNRILGLLSEAGVVIEPGDEERFRLARPGGEILASEVLAPFTGPEGTPPPGPREAPGALAVVDALRARARAAHAVPLAVIAEGGSPPPTP